MDKKEFALFAAALKTYYPKENLLPNAQAMELWFRQLQDIPYQIAEITLNKWVATNKWSPTIAEIREQATAVKIGDKPLWSDGWEQVQRNIRKYGLCTYDPDRYVQCMNSFDPLTRQVVKRLGWSNLCNSPTSEIMADRANFRMIFEQLADREHKEKQLPVNLTNLIEAVQEKEKQLMLEGKANG